MFKKKEKKEARSERKPKCLIGGDIVFFSEECSKVTKTAISPYGKVSRISMLWKGAEVRVISVYRPYHGAMAAIGSLRNAVTKLDPEFEDSFWDGALMHSDVPNLIGGDFNLGMNEMDSKIIGRGCYRIPYLESTTTFRSLAGSGWGSTIDHVLSNRKGSLARVSADSLHRLYCETKRDMKKLLLNKDEKDWLEEHGVDWNLLDWGDWKLKNDLQSLNTECLHLKSLTT